MKSVLTMGVVLAAVGVVLAGPVSERWAGPGTPASHPGTLKVVSGQVTRLVFDLSAIPRRSKVYHASLYCFTRGGAQPVKRVRICVVERLDGERVVYSPEPVELEAPWYRSFDVTEAVRRWVKDPKGNLGLAVVRFDAFLPARTYLQVVYEGKARSVPPQVTGVAAVHHDGQTFIRWREHPSYRPKPEEIIWVRKFDHHGDKLADGPGQGAYGLPNHPAITLRALRRLQGLGLRDKPSGFQGIKPLRRVRQVEPVRYRIYRHSRPITAGNIHQARLIAEVDPLSGFDGEVYKIDFKGEYLNQREIPESVIPTYCYDRGKALMPGDGMYVHNAETAGKFYYAVTMVLAGTENLRDIGPDNSLARPVAEKPAVPKPVLQWIEQPYFRKDVDAQWWRFWGAPPYTNVPGRGFRIGVGVPQKLKEPAPLAISSISGHFNVRGTLRIPSRTAVTLAVQRQLAWLPALFYNQGRGTLRAVEECKVDYYCERYMLLMINWIMSKYRIDRSRITGSLLHFGLRHPEIFTRMQMGTYTAGYDLRWAPGGGAMPGVLGPKGVKTTTGEDAWKMYSVGEYVNTYPDRDVPFLICISGTGKDRGHTCEFGWQDDPRGWRGLLRARQPFVAAWSCGLPRQLSSAFNRMRWDVSIPAFANCSLDNNPGNGDAADGDYYGQINGWLLWDDKDQIDRKDRWEMTVWLISSCPESACTVDITPRHCKAFKPRKGETFKWTNKALDSGRVVQSGTVKADRWGRLILPAVKVTKGKNRITIAR